MSRSQWMARLEWAVCLGATGAALALHAVYLAHAGGLWRDEAGGVQLATLPTLRGMLQMLTHEAFPLLFPMVIRCWSALGLGGTDFSLRCLGLVIGLSLLGAVWLNARVLRASLPLISLGLLATNLTLVRWGDSLRAYGLGCCLVLLTLASVWSLIRTPSTGRIAVAALAAVLSVQCLYQNAFLLFAICSAGCFVCFRRDQGRTALILVGIGALAGLSLLPYLGPVLASQRWWVVEQSGFNPALLWSSLSDALGTPMVWTVPVWFGLTLVASVCGMLFLPEARGRKRPGLEDAPLFAGLTLALGAPLFLLFIAISKLPTQPWYWLPLMVPAAVCIEGALASWGERYRRSRLVFTVLMVGMPLLGSLRLAGQRQTNIDLIAAGLRQQTGPNDLIVVYPWFHGVTFNRYYTGNAPWTTLPAIADFRVHRYDLIKERLAAKAPIQPVLDRMVQTRAAGNSIWIVGDLPTPPPEETGTPDLPPAPDSPYKWSDVPYNYVWGLQTRRFIAARCGQIEVVSTNAGAPVSPYESVSLSVVKGWNLPQAGP